MNLIGNVESEISNLEFEIKKAAGGTKEVVPPAADKS